MFGMNMGRMGAVGGVLPFTPSKLFTGTTTGVWYDPSDITTLYQDAAGTTPVTGIEQPVGLMLDKSKGLVLGPELVTNGGFDTDTGWTKATGVTISGGKANFANVNLADALYQNCGISAGKRYLITADVNGTGTVSANFGGNSASGATQGAGQASWRLNATSGANGNLVFFAQNFNGTLDNISVRELPGNHAFNSSGNSANFPVLSARYNQYLSTETLATQNVTTVAASYTLSFTGTGSITLSGTATGTYSAGTHTITCTAGTLTSTVSGTVTKADLRVANDALNQPTYQRVNTSTDYDTVGFKPYLKFNGTNQWLQTNSIDFSYGDKMFVSAGVRKLNDAAIGLISEFSVAAGVANPGSFWLAAPFATGASSNFAFNSVGTAQGTAPSTPYLSPITSVLSGIGNISGDQAILRINGTQAAISTSDQGTGNYGNYPLYLGARAGSSLWFNGRLYGMVVAGKQASAAEISSTETYLNQKTQAYA